MIIAKNQNQLRYIKIHKKKVNLFIPLFLKKERLMRRMKYKLYIKQVSKKWSNLYVQFPDTKMNKMIVRKNTMTKKYK